MACLRILKCRSGAELPVHNNNNGILIDYFVTPACPHECTDSKTVKYN